jgi:hypothetical protein
MIENNSQGSKSHHILSASANMLDICFLIFNIIRVSKMHEKTLLDDLCLVAILLFMASSVMSYSSIRSTTKQDSYEKAADTIFIGALLFLSLVTTVTALGLIY